MRGTTRSGKQLPGSCTVQVSTCTCESFCSCLVTSHQIRECGVSVKKRKLDEEESKMLKADLIVKRIDDELKAKKSKFIEFCIEKNNLDEQIAAEEDLLKAHNEEMVKQKNRNQQELDLLVRRKKQAEEDYKQRGKQVKNIKSKIAALQAELNKVDDTRLELVHEQDLCEAWIREVNSERIKLEQSLEKQQYEYEEKVAKKNVEIENLKIRLSEVLNGIENLPSESDAPYKGLREFIEKEIATKEKELECPICMVVAASPILTCSEQHLICSLCRTKTEQCPVCSRSYHGKHKRHRYAEQALEEVTRLRRELEGLMARTVNGGNFK